MKKYKLTKDTIQHYGRTLHRIEALKSFHSVTKGDLGGYVESESNLSHDDNCWVFADAKVFANAKVFDESQVFGNAQVYGNAEVYGNAMIFGKAHVSGDARGFGNAQVSGNTYVSGNAEISGKAHVSGDARGFGNAAISSKKYVYIDKGNYDSYSLLMVTDVGKYMKWVSNCG